MKCLFCTAVVWFAVVESSFVYATALDAYVALPDASYDWTQDGPSWTEGSSWTYYTTATNLQLTSQTWRDSSEVTPTVWTHYVTVIVPGGLAISLAGGVHDTALVLINGGDISGSAPTLDPADPTNGQYRNLAVATRSVIVELRGVPNQPLQFSDEGFTRTEDEIIAYTWDKYLQGGDNWLADMPYYDIIPRRTGDDILNLADFTAFGLHWLGNP